MSREFDGNDGWMNGPDGEIESGSNQNQPYFPPKEERDQEIPHDMYGDYDPTDDLDLFNSDDLEEEPEDDDMDNVIGIHNIKGEATEIAAAKRRHPGQWRGPVRGDSELDTGKPDYFNEVPAPLGDEQKEINRRGIQASKDALNGGLPKNVIPFKPRKPKRP